MVDHTTWMNAVRQRVSLPGTRLHPYGESDFAFGNHSFIHPDVSGPSER